MKIWLITNRSMWKQIWLWWWFKQWMLCYLNFSQNSSPAANKALILLHSTPTCVPSLSQCLTLFIVVDLISGREPILMKSPTGTMNRALWMKVTQSVFTVLPTAPGKRSAIWCGFSSILKELIFVDEADIVRVGWFCTAIGVGNRMLWIGSAVTISWLSRKRRISSMMVNLHFTTSMFWACTVDTALRQDCALMIWRVVLNLRTATGLLAVSSLNHFFSSSCNLCSSRGVRNGIDYRSINIWWGMISRSRSREVKVRPLPATESRQHFISS